MEANWTGDLTPAKMDDMSKASFNVLYDGPALANSEMDVRDLAPALLALGELLEEANAAVNEGKTQVSVQVKASFKTGCFGVELDVAQGLLQQAEALFRHEHVATAKELLEWLGLIGSPIGGLLWLVKKLRGQKVSQVVLLDNGKTRIVVDGEPLEVEQAVVQLYRQLRVRKALESVLRPLDSEGIDTFAVTNLAQTERFIEINKAERVFFKAPDADSEFLSEEETIVNLQLVSISFQDGNKWRFHDGASTFYAAMLDESFIAQVEASAARFGKGDILKARMQRRQVLVGEEIKTEYSVLEVVEHRKAGIQLKMSFTREGQDYS